MPRGRPKQTKESEKDSNENPFFKKVETVLTSIVDKLDKFSERLEKLENNKEDIKQQEQQEQKIDRPAPVVPSIETVSTITEIPVPPDYRVIVSEVLNEKFEIEMSASADRPEFDFRIIVPEQFSDMDTSQKAMFKRDVRSKVIPYAEGSNGVRKWSERVFSSFNPDMKTKIKLYMPAR